MIITLTPNPSLDRTIELSGPLARGEVQRAGSSHEEPGGKGVNIVRALEASGILSLAILPGDDMDPVLVALRADGVPHLGMPIGATIRSNVAITEPDGTTTKVNVPGPVLTPAQQAALIELVLEKAEGASWLVLAGSLPPGVPVDFYARITRELRTRFGTSAPKVAVDSSGAPLAAAVTAGPDLIKPNAEELAELTGIPDPDSLEGNPELVARAAQRLVAGGVGAVLATLGSKGAVLVTADGAWLAQTPPMVAVSTVGAGDSSLAGYLLSTSAGEPAPDSLRQAAAHGAAAASLPGSTVPALNQTKPGDVTVTTLVTHPKEDVQ
ncbi:1-phosphofructokinase family hexose kinase [Cryobacterium sp. TMT1-21]|uniref:1-phosphofructokinase family hexose kinase n=1 Tax=Cryobacterium shii TaxID=1259235 RepID=A0AAQ2C937_9MICO|nr:MULTISPECIES: 1-phosphofructokinase family hexose kinase [Cryobacterium]TFC52886.1 1-phosphofructokinase family hexose kinase [Cryobacterium shii]TFC82094.1 1-phosphofructokinase family hexose kinase [Cryobacterium sp. TmT2-59]TFD18045.1 1-phosphofructokinase family hexose kinase [Cryobacterium sp. TMT1-21]TFD19640.1 1-phosphofructokinase family hexose kinase [Cryobacterium sp. TMT4-10]TFD25063.1 1-phosphofructokinase family hexose kinase [Cryobacterium sp. TMT2-23]